MSTDSGYSRFVAEPVAIRGVLRDVSGLVRGDVALLVLRLRPWRVDGSPPSTLELHAYSSCASAEALTERLTECPDLGSVVTLRVHRNETHEVLGRALAESEVWMLDASIATQSDPDLERLAVGDSDSE